MRRCEICGRPLGLRDWLRGLSGRETSFSYRRVDGAQHEQAVRWICRKCKRKGERYRKADATIGLETQGKEP